MKQIYHKNPIHSLPTAGKTAHRWLAYGLSLFLTLACLMSAKAQWTNVGSAGFSTGGAEYQSIKFHPTTGEPYVAYRDVANGYKTTVMKFTGGVWTLVGTAGFSEGVATYQSLAFHPTAPYEPYVAYQDSENSYKTTVMKFTSGTWVVVGTVGFSAGTASFQSLTFHPTLGEPYVAYRDFANSGKTTVMKFTSSTWVVVGTAGFSAGGASQQKLAFHPTSGEPYVAYRDGGNSNKTTVMKFTSGSWIVEGIAGFSAGSAQNQSLAFHPIAPHEPYVAYSDATNGNKSTVMKFTSGSWTNVGTAAISAGYAYEQSLAFHPTSNEPYVAYVDGANSDKTSVMKFTSGTWVLEGIAGFSAGFTQYQSLAFHPTTGEPHVAYRDNGNGSKTTVMKFVNPPPPAITLSTTTLSGAFSNTTTNSASQTFTASGANLTGSVNLALSTTDWELSTDNVTFSPTLTLTNSGTLSATTVYVRLKQGLASGMKAAILTASSAGATNKTIALTGTANAFVTTWITSDGSIVIPTDVNSYNYSVVWTNLTTGAVGSITGQTTDCTIAGLIDGDIYQIAITGVFPQFYMANNANERLKIRTIAQWGDIAWTSMENAFRGCNNLTYTATDIPNLSAVISMFAMFGNCTNFNGNIGSWNTSAVTNMLFMFLNCTNFNQNIGSWNTSAVTNMGYMFFNATAFNQNIGSWQLNSNVVLGNMLDNCGMNIANYEATLAGWTTQSVTGRTLGAAGRQYCNVADRTTLTGMKGWIINGDAPSGSCPPAITLSTTILSGAFSNTTTNSASQTFTASGANLTGSVSLTFSNTDWELSTDNTTFSPAINLAPSGSVLSSTTIYVRLKQGLASGMKTATLTASSAGATNKTINLTGTANAFVTTWITGDNTITIPTNGALNYSYSVVWTNPTTGVVGSATGLNGNYTITGLTNTQTYQVAITGVFPHFFMINNATEKGKIQTIAQWGDIAWTSMNFAFAGCNNLTYAAIDIPNLSGVTGMAGMFGFCTNFNGNIGGWDTSMITNMNSLFTNATSFNQDISTWTTNAVTSMNTMFYNATSFNQNISNWNTNLVTDMGFMFSGATNFNQNIGSWQLSSNVNLTSMLDNCGMNIANYDATLAGWATQAVTNRTLGASGRQYCNVAAWNTLDITNNWTITDAGLSGSCSPAPEINLTGNSMSIFMGDTSPATADHTDFGSTAISTPIVRTFTIQNTGSVVLNISSISNSNPTDFTVGTAPTSIVAGGSATFTVTLNSATAGIKNATITINNDDTNEGAYDFAITGNITDVLANAQGRGNMLSLNGAGQYVAMPTNPLATATAMTMETWVYPTQNNQWARIIDFGDAPGDNMFLTASWGGTGIARFVMNVNTGGEQQVSATNPLSLDTWTHIAVTLSGTTATMYIDGVEVGQNTGFTLNPATLGATVNNWFGRAQYNDPYFQGNIDEVRLWNVARTQAQIRESMHLTLAGNEAGLVGYYQFNETTSDAIDAVAGNNGVLQNSPTRTTSTVSVGKGVSKTIAVPTTTAGSEVSLATTQFEMDFNTMSPAGEIVITQITGETPYQNTTATANTTSCYWIVRNFGANTSTLDFNSLTFQIPNHNIISTTDEGSPANLKVYKRETNAGGTWAMVGSASSASNTTKQIVFNTPAMTSFSEFIIGSAASPLPITLVRFAGERVNGGTGKTTEEVKLTWTTAQEINNKGFEIQVSENAQTYKTIAFVEGRGNSTIIQSYNHTTIQPYDSYYRLRQVDFDGKFTYSPVVFVAGIESLKVYPNPNNGTFSISVGKDKLDLPAQLLNAQGKEVWRGVQTEVKTNLPAGMYFLHTVVAGKARVTKIVIYH